MILVDVIPGQETGNADYVVSGNAGVLVRDSVEVLETMAHWLEKDRCHYQEQAQNARQLGRPRAAYETADLAWALASPREKE
jgi:UDP-N-acetylglucosamine:LPS N-acetylglucosamine transferase